jgi:hypothetical protein
MRNRFQDPNGVRSAYEWELGHFEEEETSKRRNIEHGANTANTGLVRQQGDDTPLVLKYSGTILVKAQLVEMLAWWQLCADQTIYFRDFAGDEYEVLISAFSPTRHYTIRNPRDFANAPHHFWRYTIEMEVVRIIAGTFAGVSP